MPIYPPVVLLTDEVEKALISYDKLVPRAQEARLDRFGFGAPRRERTDDRFRSKVNSQTNTLENIYPRIIMSAITIDKLRVATLLRKCVHVTGGPWSPSGRVRREARKPRGGVTLTAARHGQARVSNWRHPA